MSSKQRKLNSAVAEKQPKPRPACHPLHPIPFARPHVVDEETWRNDSKCTAIINLTYRMPYGKPYTGHDGDNDRLDAAGKPSNARAAAVLPKTWVRAQTLVPVEPGDVSINPDLVTVADLHFEGNEYSPRSSGKQFTMPLTSSSLLMPPPRRSQRLATRPNTLANCLVKQFSKRPIRWALSERDLTAQSVPRAAAQIFSL